MTFWTYLWQRLFGPPRSIVLALPGNTAVEKPALRAMPLAKEIAWLESLIAANADGMRLDEIANDVFWGRIQTIEQQDDALVAQWLEKFVQLKYLSKSTATALQLKLVEIAVARGEVQSVRDHLYALAEVPEHACNAHYQLAEYHRKRGDDVLAMREYEAVLAIQVDYPNVRQRYERLKLARGEVTQTASETMVGAGTAGGEGNRYLLVRELGRGAAGVVYLARDMQLEREVAVKLLHPHLAAANQKHIVDRFFDEARGAASLRHPNIVAILDLDEKARRIVMELCDGGTLRALLRDRGPRPMRRALERHAQILSALDAAHARGVVHRDVKPANLMFRRDPDLPGAEIVLGDFGIAHLPDDKGQTGGQRAIETRAVGTIAYMAPEQRQGLVTYKSDIYASGVVLFEMLTGGYPWSRDQLLAGVRNPGDFALPKALHDEFPKLCKLLQVHLDAISAPDAKDRPDTTTAMKQARRLRDMS